MSWPSLSRWSELWRAAGAANPSAVWHKRLGAAYAEPHRHYHNQRHIADCLAEFDDAKGLAANPVAVELALWFHDAVYDPKAADNEEQSAALLNLCATEHRISRSLAEQATRLVMATKTHSIDGDPDATLMVDVDLSILGQNEERFSEYERQIRQEYNWVPQAVFASKRAEILSRFLARPAIFFTEKFRAKYEEQARRNLKNSIGHLQGLTG